MPHIRYMVSLQCLPELFAQLTIHDLRLMGAPRRITRFVKSTIAESKKEEKKTDETKELGAVEVALQSFMSEIGSDSMLCRFTQSLDITVQENRMFLALSQSNNKESDGRAFVFANTFITRDLFDKVTLLRHALGK